MPYRRRFVFKIAEKDCQGSFLAYAGERPGGLPLQFDTPKIVLVVVHQLATHPLLDGLPGLDGPAPVGVPFNVIIDCRIPGSGDRLQVGQQDLLDRPRGGLAVALGEGKDELPPPLLRVGSDDVFKQGEELP